MTQWKRSHLVICGLYLRDMSEISIKFCMKSANGNPAYLKIYHERHSTYLSLLVDGSKLTPHALKRVFLTFSLPDEQRPEGLRGQRVSLRPRAICPNTDTAFPELPPVIQETWLLK